MTPLRTRLTLSTAILALLGCGGGSASGSAPVTVTPAPSPTPSPTASPTPMPSGTPTPTAAAPACVTVVADRTSLSPYSDTAFRAALDNVRSLQFPFSANACLSTAGIQAFRIDPDNWYRDAAGRMVFSFRNGVVDDDDAGATTRMELRGQSFDATASGKVLDASFQLPAFAERSGSFTLMQVYGESAGLPILRVAYIAQRNGVSDHLWATYRRGAGDGDATTIDLGAAPGAGVTARVRIAYNVGGAIELFYGGTGATTRFTDNLSFWAAAGKTTYLKAGCYLQQPGGCEVLFTALTLDR